MRNNNPLYNTGIALMDIPQGHLEVIAYKLWDNKIPDYSDKIELVEIILNGLEVASNKLQGHTLPADYHHINKML